MILNYFILYEFNFIISSYHHNCPPQIITYLPKQTIHHQKSLRSKIPHHSSPPPSYHTIITPTTNQPTPPQQPSYHTIITTTFLPHHHHTNNWPTHATTTTILPHHPVSPTTDHHRPTNHHRHQDSDRKRPHLFDDDMRGHHRNLKDDVMMPGARRIDLNKNPDPQQHQPQHSQHQPQQFMVSFFCLWFNLKKQFHLIIEILFLIHIFISYFCHQLIVRIN